MGQNIALDWSILFWISYYWFGLVNINLDWLRLVWIGCYQSRWIEYKKVLINTGKDWLVSVELYFGLTNIT